MTFQLKVPYTETHRPFSDTRYDLIFYSGNLTFQPPLVPICLKSIQNSSIDYEFTEEEKTRETKGTHMF